MRIIMVKRSLTLINSTTYVSNSKWLTEKEVVEEEEEEEKKINLV